jgi:hypothetical protein
MRHVAIALEDIRDVPYVHSLAAHELFNEACSFTVVGVSNIALHRFIAWYIWSEPCEALRFEEWRLKCAEDIARNSVLLLPERAAATHFHCAGWRDPHLLEPIRGAAFDTLIAVAATFASREYRSLQQAAAEGDCRLMCVATGRCSAAI